MNKWRSCVTVRHFHGSNRSRHTRACFLLQEHGELQESVTVFQHPTPFACNLQLSAYARHGHLGNAKFLFDGMKERDPVSWNSFMNGFSLAGHLETLRLVFERMPGWNLVSWNTIIAAYARKGHMEEASRFFDGLGEYASVLSWNSLLVGYVLGGHSLEAMKLFQRMLVAGVRPSSGTFVNLLEACSSPEALENGKLLHVLVAEAGLQSVPEVGGALIKMYGRCSDETSLEEVGSVFWSIQSRGVVLWTAIITVYAKARLGGESLTLFRLMNLEGVRPDRVTFITVLDGCEVISDGRWIHSLVSETGIHLDMVLGTAMVNMYGKCGAVSESREVFNSLTKKNVYTWSAMINAYTRNRFTFMAFELFKHMDLDGCLPSNVTYATILDGPTSPVELKLIRACIEEEGFASDVQVAEALINRYSKLGLIEEAESVFRRAEVPVPSLRSAMIRAYVDNRLMHQAEEMLFQLDITSVKCIMGGYLEQSRFKEVMAVFLESMLEGVRPDKFIFITVLGACGGLKDVRLVKLLDAEVKSYQPDVMVASALVCAYGKCGSVEDSRLVFEGTAQRNVVTWNSMLASYSSNGLLAVAEEVLVRMAERDTVSWNTMVTAYSLHGRLEDAKRLFDRTEEKNIVSWTNMMRAYVKNGCPKTALELLAKMDSDGLEANMITLLTAFEACAQSLSLHQGRDIHVSCSWDEERVAAAGIIHMYGKCGRPELAREVFGRLKWSSRELWTSMIGACAGNGYNTEALKLFSCMDLEGVQPDSVTYVNVFTTCSNIGDRRQLNTILSSIWNGTEVALEEDEYVGLALLNMFTKCGGTVEETERLFHLLEAKLGANHVQHRQVLWSSLIGAYTRSGLPLEALFTFKTMLVEGVLPDSITLILVLSACSHAGLLAEAVEQFVSMQEEFGLSPELDHFVCMVDLIGRSGRLAEAEELIHTMPLYPSSLCWSTLLASCKTQGDLTHARYVHSMYSSSHDAVDFLLLSNTCTP